MHVANYLSYNKQNVSLQAIIYSDAIFTLLQRSFKLNPVTISISYLSKISKLFPCSSSSSKGFMNFRLSRTRSIINWFLIKKELLLNEEVICSVE